MATTARRFTAHTNADNVQAQRKRELGHIHQGRAALCWSDDDYRFHLRNLTEKDSASDLDAVGRRKVLDHMATLGYKPKAAKFQPFDQAAKIKWLWKKIGEAGGLRDASPAYLIASRLSHRPSEAACFISRLFRRTSQLFFQKHFVL